MKISDFYFELPEELIATHPAERRDGSRLMVLTRGEAGVEHRRFPDVLEYLRAGDCLVLNDSRVLKARLHGKRRPGGGGCEILLLKPLPNGDWEAMVRPGKKLKVGAVVDLPGGAEAAIIDTVDGRTGGIRISRTGDKDAKTEGENAAGTSAEDARSLADGASADGVNAGNTTADGAEDFDLNAYLEAYGEVPLPPYIVQQRQARGEALEEEDDSLSDGVCAGWVGKAMARWARWRRRRRGCISRRNCWLRPRRRAWRCGA